MRRLLRALRKQGVWVTARELRTIYGMLSPFALRPEQRVVVEKMERRLREMGQL